MHAPQPTRQLNLKLTQSELNYTKTRSEVIIHFLCDNSHCQQLHGGRRSRGQGLAGRVLVAHCLRQGCVCGAVTGRDLWGAVRPEMGQLPEVPAATRESWIPHKGLFQQLASASRKHVLQFP